MLYAAPARAGGRLVIGSDTGGDEHTQMYLLDPDGRDPRPLDPNPAVIHSFGRWAPDSRKIAYAANTRARAYFDIYTLDVDTPDAQPVCVYQQDGSNSASAWSPNSDALIVNQAISNVNTNLYLVPLAGGEPRLLTPHEGDAYYGSVQWTPDGTALYCISDVGREWAALWRLDLASDQWEIVTAPSWDVEECRLTRDGTRLAYTVNAGGYSQLIVRDVATGAERRPPGRVEGTIAPTAAGDTGTVSSLAWSPDGSKLAFNYNSATLSPDVWVWDLAGDTLAQMTRSGQANLPTDLFVEPQLVHYPASDGLQIPGFLYLPREQPDGPIPCVIWVHGGPESQQRTSFSPVFQYFIHRGYAVFTPNVRGSAGYGRTYVHLDDVRLRMDSVRDLAEGVAWLRAGGVVDPDRIAVVGGSYGGFMVLAALTTYPDLWAAGVDIVGIANFVTFLENTGPWRRKLREAEYGSLEADGDFLREISPIHHADQIVTPLMVVHGANDPRVPLNEAEQIVANLQRRGYPVEYLVFPDEGHGIAKLKNRLVAYPAIGDFLDRYLGTGG